jgi:DHA1 family bicyclomycin/chloramphenicol resistance-like MFS transporter
MIRKDLEWKYLFLIIVIFIAACIETDIYLPAFADMMTFFSISEEKIQSLLTWNFIGVCLAGPLYGPISDAIGRKKPLMIALSLFLIGSLMTLFANQFNWMLFGRVLQGLGSGGCFTLGTAIIFDAFPEKKAIHALNRINSIVPFIMAGAPVLGGYLNQTFGFRSNFLAITICVVLSFVICLLYFRETLSKENLKPLEIGKIIADFKKVCLSIPFWQTTSIVSLLFAGYIAFLSCISVLFVLEFGISKEALPYCQAALLGAWIIGNISFKGSLNKLGMNGVKKIGTGFFGIGGIGLVVVAWLAPESAILSTSAMMLYAFGANWVQGLYFPEGMELFPDIKGITSSVLTSARLLITALVVAIASKLYDGTIYPVVGVIFSITVIIFVTIIFYERKRKHTAAALPAESHVVEIF